MKWQSFRAFLRQRFTRVTSSVAYIPQIDGLRSLALLLVIGHHVFAIYLQDTHRLGTQLLPRDWPLILPRSPLVSWGMHLAFGVPIFFAISGFVLAMPFAQTVFERGKLPSIRLYLLRRLIRLEPPYFLSMTFLFFVIVFPWHQPHWYFNVMFRIFGPHYLASIAYLHGLIYGGPSWIGGVAWTLEIEIQFYLLMPLFALLFKVRSAAVRRATFLALAVAASLFSQFVVPSLSNPRVANSLAGHLEFFLAGILLADVYLDPPPSLRFGRLAADACAVISAALIVYILHWQTGLAWLQPFLVIAFYFGVFHPGWAGRIFRHRFLTVPGTMCYTIYLYHYFIAEKWMQLTVRLLPPAHSLWFDSGVQMILVLPPLLVVSAMLYLAIERPFVVLSHTATRRWWPAIHPAAPEVTP
jgi:peptidoglycan/LPS O-acetylase OafA/YrhL